MELQGENHIIVAIERRLKRTRKDAEGARWDFMVDGFAIYVKEQGFSEVVKVLEMDSATLEIESFIAGADFSGAITYSDEEEALSARLRLVAIARHLQENYLWYAHISGKKI
jgi:hypothetical protein